MIAFGENILLWRLHRSLSQERLASLSGIPRANLSDIEKGKRDVTLSTVRVLADALGVQPGILVNGEPPGHMTGKKDFSREFMERVARSTALGKPPRDPEELKIYSLLREAVSCGLVCARTRRKRLPLPGRKSSRAWLLLRACYSAETVNSLIERAIEHAERQ